MLIGQDPYHDDGQAHGLCFSVKHGVNPPPSLKNMFKELKTDLGLEPPSHGNLEAWARQGVLLLNAVLTVRAHEANSHKDRGWERFTDLVIDASTGASNRSYSRFPAKHLRGDRVADRLPGPRGRRRAITLPDRGQAAGG